MPNILDEIIANKRREVEASALPVDLDAVQLRPTVSMRQALLDSPTGIIAEFKRRSPSKGEIHPMAKAYEVVPGYEREGAAASSVLTDTVYFGGALTDLMAARQLVKMPLLRKDFIISTRQIDEARLAGADAVLLIAAALTAEEVRLFTRHAHSLGLEVLFEIHNSRELDKFFDEVDMVGVNNRDLTTFATDPALSMKAAELLPPCVVKVAESGLSSLGEVLNLRRAGYRGFLIGETFMRHAQPPVALREFLSEQ